MNNPDALLVLLMVGAAYLLVRALESGRTKHLAWCGALVGLAFMTKMLQGWMIVPALGAAYLLAGPPALRRRGSASSRVAGAAMVARQRRLAGRRLPLAGARARTSAAAPTAACGT